MQNIIVPILITNVHEYANKNQCTDILGWVKTSDGIVNEKFEWGRYDMMIPIAQCCKRYMNLINTICYISI